MTSGRCRVSVRVCFAAAQIAAVTGQPAFAQDPPPVSAQFAAYLKSPEYESLLIGHTVQAERVVFPACQDVALVQHGLGQVAQPPSFRGDIHPIAGEWLDHVLVDRCGTRAMENMLVMAVDGAAPAIVALLPGATVTGPQLQHDATAIAFQSAAAQAKKSGNDVALCGQKPRLVVIDTQLDGVTSAAQTDAKGELVAGAWDETWTVRACGQPVAVPLHFAANGAGGTNFTLRQK